MEGAASPVSEKRLSAANARPLETRSLPRASQACWWPGKQFCELESSLQTLFWWVKATLEGMQVGELES